MRYLAVGFLFLAMICGFQALAAAQQAIPFVSVGFRGGLSSYVMSDVNVAINSVNDVLLAQRFDELNEFGSGPMGGGELRVRVRPHIAASVTIEYLYETSKVGLEIVGQQFRELEIHASTVPITARVLYVASNAKNPKIVYTLGGGLSYLSLGRLKTQSSPTINPTNQLFPSSELRTADGTGVGFQAAGGAEYFVRPRLSVGAELLYRYAKITNLTYNDNGDRVLNDAGKKIDLDFSGISFSACIRLHL